MSTFEELEAKQRKQAREDTALGMERDPNSPEAIARQRETKARERQAAHAKIIATLNPTKKYLVTRRGLVTREWLHPKDIPIGAKIFNTPAHTEIIKRPTTGTQGAPGYPSRADVPRDSLWTRDADRTDED